MWRKNILEKIDKPWDIVVVGGGITGAGIFREAAKKGLSCLMLEQNDFSSGTSSRSGKLVHGGLRYLKQGQFLTTYHSVHERQKLLKKYSDLVVPLDFFLPMKKNDAWAPFLLKAGLTIYDLMAGRRSHKRINYETFLKRFPKLESDLISGGFCYQDALTDDASLVIRTIKEAIAFGGSALNYVTVQDLLKDRDGKVTGVVCQDSLTDIVYEIQSQATVNATGAWTDNLRKKVGKKTAIRKLRGSHLIIPQERLPVASAVGITHPEDKRPLYLLPWKGSTLIGTTDLDHDESLNQEPKISKAEGDYLFEAVNHWFPLLKLNASDVISTFAGVRPVLDTGKQDSSKESREHVVWAEKGLVTVTGGKLTTFQLLACDVLKAATKFFRKRPEIKNRKIISNDVSGLSCLSENNLNSGKAILLDELCRSMKEDWVVHLEDLLLRRTRVGLLTPDGGMDFLDEIKTAVKPHIPWDENRWNEEIGMYKKKWKDNYSPELVQ